MCENLLRYANRHPRLLAEQTAGCRQSAAYRPCQQSTNPLSVVLSVKRTKAVRRSAQTALGAAYCPLLTELKRTFTTSTFTTSVARHDARDHLGSDPNGIPPSSCGGSNRRPRTAIQA